ncbi:hypothetical protein [Halobacillus sp. Marseille-Q1614]|uniref:hypothetical protein n=1 Tax=Halobacillus sp. Marseille-Q1614 TaxID=2709134 RepID=UPI0015702BDA|nr:hypothetical protein [Halobacillus sp. Marseille-Q1614]
MDNNPPEPVNSRVDYFLWLKDSMLMISVANATANISASNTVIGTTPFLVGMNADHP